MSSPGEDPLRDQLLAAAARVFARQGFDGTKVMDVVREAGLSTGAVYGRFRSKQELLREAVVAGVTGPPPAPARGRVADALERAARRVGGPLSDADALRVEAMVAARRDPEVAAAIADAEGLWHERMAPVVAAAQADGTVAADVDPAAVVFFVRVVQLGLLLHRAAGLPPPEVEGWTQLVHRVVASFGEEPLFSAAHEHEGES